MAQYARKRKIERISLAFPLTGRVGMMDVVLLDVSMFGCRLEHTVPLKVGANVRLTFHWEDEKLDVESTVVRCSLGSFSSGANAITVYHSGLRFNDSGGGPNKTLRALISEQIARALEEQKANARGDLPKFIERMAIFSGRGLLTATTADVRSEFERGTSLPYIRIARERGYLTYSLEKTGWKKKRTREPDPPEEGFTVWAYEDEEQLEQLCRAYENADDSMRTLIRLCAEMSLLVDDTIPPQRFEP